MKLICSETEIRKWLVEVATDRDFRSLANDWLTMHVEIERLAVELKQIEEFDSFIASENSPMVNRAMEKFNQRKKDLAELVAARKVIDEARECTTCGYMNNYDLIAALKEYDAVIK